jgi:2,3-dihydroxybenzoate decarboxylase
MKRMEDLGVQRIREMDEAGIDLQVLSHSPPGSQGVREDVVVAWTKSANDRLHAAVQNHPTRFAGFASLPTTHPVAAADELERAVNKLGFKGGMLHSLTEGPFLDDKRYWPIFERAAALDVPLYIHPADPNPAVIKAYYATMRRPIRRSFGRPGDLRSKPGLKPCVWCSAACSMRIRV